MISASDWQRYIFKLAKINQKAAELMQQWMEQHGASDFLAIVNYAYALISKYGESSAAWACERYDAIAAAQNSTVPAAVPAATATYSEVAKSVGGALKQSSFLVPNTVGRLVKQAGADTTLQNALRDGAEFAWIPSGDTCAFCITLASRGWQRASKHSIRNGHAEHIHSNCNCEYAVRFGGRGGVAGYDPDKYRDMYDGADGFTPQQKINAMRRQAYAKNKDKINAQKRANYAQRNAEAVNSNSNDRQVF